MTINNRIEAFNRQRGLLDEFNRNVELAMLEEELREFKDAPNRHELIDVLDDIIVVATGALFKLGIDPDLSMLETLTEIESRRQNPIQADNWLRNGSNGEKWLKDKNQCPETLYQADYDDCGTK